MSFNNGLLLIDLQMPIAQTATLLNPVTSFPNTATSSNLPPEQTISGGYTATNNTAPSNISPVDMQRNTVYNTNSKYTFQF